MIPRIVAHTRCGTHLLAKLLFLNYDCGVEKYEDLHYSHTRRPEDGRPYIHLFRPVYPVMRSIWQIRERLGIATSVSFSEMLRTPWEQMPRADRAFAIHDGIFDGKVCPPPEFEGLLLTRWVKNTTIFARDYLDVSYDAVCARPYLVCKQIAEAFQLPRRAGTFEVPRNAVGWIPDVRHEPKVTEDDFALMERYQEVLEWLFNSSSSAMVRRPSTKPGG